MEKKTPILHLPHELIIQILLKLPVKSLIRFKCVCKSWFSLISDPQFAKSHFQLNPHTRRIMCMSHSLPTFRSIDFEPFPNNDPASFNINFSFPESDIERNDLNNDLTFPFIDFERLLNNYTNNGPASSDIDCSLPESDFPYIIKGSCRGFIFMFRHENFYLWNPCTGFKKQIPLSPFASKIGVNRYNHFDGFGYDQSRDDYLIVVMSPGSTVANVVTMHVEFFSCRNNTWKEIEDTHFPYTVVYNKRWIFNGAIHWLSCCNELQKNVIVAFDLKERKLLDIKLPDDFNHRPYSHGLWVFGEFLSLWAKDDFNGRVKIWVMKEYKVHSSWTKTLVLPFYPVGNHCLYPLYCTKNGDIVGRNGSSRLVKYNDKGLVLGHHTFSDSPSDAVVMYTESLLSLPGDNDQV